MKKLRREETHYHGRKSRWEKKNTALLVAAVFFLALAVLCTWILPGVRFSGILSLCCAGSCAALILLNIWAGKNRAGRICRIIVLACLCVGIAIFAFAETVIVRAGTVRAGRTPEAVIVLGAGVNGKNPSLVLSSRIQAAAAYLKEHPDVPAVLSGGQGTGEQISEAQAMQNALEEKGIRSDRLILEENSSTTAENFEESIKLLRERGMNPEKDSIAIVTSNFHIYRARRIAQRAGMCDTFGVPAETSWWWLNANYYIREFFALGKMTLLKQI